ARPQPRYDRRIRDLVQRTGDVTIATALRVRTARGWLRGAPTIVVGLDVVTSLNQSSARTSLSCGNSFRSSRRSPARAGLAPHLRVASDIGRLGLSGYCS